MVKLNKERQQYFELEKHTILQNVMFIFLLIMFIVLVFSLILPFIQNIVIEKFLGGVVFNQGQLKEFMKETPGKMIQTDFYFSWAIDIYLDTPQEARNWFNPVLSLALPISLFSFWLSLVISSILPTSIGLMKHKIDREVVNVLDKIHFNIYGFYSDKDNQDLIEEILQADTRELHSISENWKVLHEDIKIIQKVLLWREGGVLYRFLHPGAGIGFYLRFYFTEKYSNVILGLVYIGAAVLIIIIGMRGLKFIPSTQPSLIFFALGLEFSVLLTYAFSVMYSRSDSEYDQEQSNKSENSQNTYTLDLGNSKEVENLLRAFIRSPKIKPEYKNELKK
jgi:ABC-type multidrug transport system fused ATPase/permease subunit